MDSDIIVYDLRKFKSKNSNNLDKIDGFLIDLDQNANVKMIQFHRFPVLSLFKEPLSEPSYDFDGEVSQDFDLDSIHQFIKKELENIS